MPTPNNKKLRVVLIYQNFNLNNTIEIYKYLKKEMVNLAVYPYKHHSTRTHITKIEDRYTCSYNKRFAHHKSIKTFRTLPAMLDFAISQSMFLLTADEQIINGAREINHPICAYF